MRLNDREKVIKGLETCICFGTGMQYECTGCPYDTKELVTKCLTKMQEDALALLKEQEPVEPSVDVDTYVCPNCGHRLEHQGMLGDNVIFDERYDFCPGCGRAVKWDDLR